MSDGRVLFDTAEKIDEAAQERVRKGIGKGGDVLISHKGTIGRVARAPLESPPFVCSPQTTFWRVVDESKVDRNFLFTLLRSRKFQTEFSVRAGETDMAGYVSLTSQRALELSFPSIEIQRAIGGFIGSLDDKIELNRQMNETLEAMARALFRDWFVDFGPTRRQMEGATDPVKIMGSAFPNVDKAAELAALFPKTLGEDGLPVGWEKKPVGEISEIVGGGTPSTKNGDYWNEGIHLWATPRDLSKLSGTFIDNTERKLSEKGLGKVSSGLSPTGSVLMSSRAPIGYLAIAAKPIAVNQGFIAMRPTEKFPTYFAKLWCQENMETIESNANGSTFQEISKKNFKPIEVNLPCKPTRVAFTSFAEALYKKILSNENENTSLTAMRDLLLPRLMSGEIRVRGGNST